MQTSTSMLWGVLLLCGAFHLDFLGHSMRAHVETNLNGIKASVNEPDMAEERRELAELKSKYGAVKEEEEAYAREHARVFDSRTAHEQHLDSSHQTWRGIRIKARELVLELSKPASPDFLLAKLNAELEHKVGQTMGAGGLTEEQSMKLAMLLSATKPAIRTANQISTYDVVLGRGTRWSAGEFNVADVRLLNTQSQRLLTIDAFGDNDVVMIRVFRNCPEADGRNAAWESNLWNANVGSLAWGFHDTSNYGPHLYVHFVSIKARLLKASRNLNHFTYVQCGAGRCVNPYTDVQIVEAGVEVKRYSNSQASMQSDSPLITMRLALPAREREGRSKREVFAETPDFFNVHGWEPHPELRQGPYATTALASRMTTRGFRGLLQRDEQAAACQMVNELIDGRINSGL